MKNWWLRAEKRAGIEHVKGRGWHSLRRKFATELQDIPLKELCQLGGWNNPVTLLTSYQQPEEQRMRSALARRTQLRNAS